MSVKTYRDSGNFKTEEYTYDLYSRITQKQIKENTTLRSTESYTYSISGTTTKSTAGADGTAIADQIETVDAYGRLLSSQFKNGSETFASTYTYDCFDNCLTATDPMGTKTTNTYDIFGNLLTSQTPYSGTVSNTYDMAGRRQTATDRNGNTAVYHYDVLDRLILEETPFDEQNTAKKKYFYDSASNLISEKQQKNAPGEAESYRTVNYAYNNRNQITAVSGDTVPVSYTYDSAENMIRQQIGSGEETAEYHYTYNTLGQVLSETNPLGKANSYTYDFAGNVLTKTDRNGNVTQNTYGIFGISKIQIGTSVTDYSYNGIGQLMQKKLTSSQKLTDEESYTYDPFGRMTACENQDCSITNPEVADNGYLLQYSYDKNSNLLGYTLSENQTQKSVVSYQYDQNNRLTKATLDGKIFLYQYDQNGNLLQKQGGGITTQIAYNKANLPVSYQNGTLQSYAYTYALDGNRLTDSETVSQVQKSYQYTNRGELSAETVNGATTAYTYDSRGNRLTKTGADTATYLYDLANRMTKETHDTWYEDNYYDNAGNLTDVYHFYQNADNPDSYGMQFWWYRYNELNQLTSYHKNGDEWTYTYNVNGLRNSKQASHGDTATFTWNGGNMIREKDSVMENIYTYGVDGVAAQKNRLWDLVYQKNAHGDVVSITNINGDTTDSYTYDAFGNQPSSAADYYKNFRFCGEYTDPETGFVYLRNRYYNPSTGRFITEDPVQDGMNWYGYCGGNPVMRVDPWGLKITATEEEFNIILPFMQVLTDDELGFENGEVVILTRCEEPTLIEGTTLIRDLIDYSKDISLTLSEKECRYENKVIEFNPNQKSVALTLDTNNILAWLPIPPEMALGHEFIHAHREINRRTSTSDDNDYFFGVKTPLEELYTVGLAKNSSGKKEFNSTQHVTENTLRQEHGYPIRMAYLTRNSYAYTGYGNAKGLKEYLEYMVGLREDF